jgi:hypothetical protein
MNKEKKIEILNKIFEPTSFDCKTEFEDLQIAITLNPNLNKILCAMQEYAAQFQADNADLAIKFADWINKNDYEKIHGDRWCKKFMSFTHTTQELYDIYLIKTSQNK